MTQRRRPPHRPPTPSGPSTPRAAATPPPRVAAPAPPIHDAARWQAHWSRVAEALDGELRPHPAPAPAPTIAIVSRSRVRPWKIDFPPGVAPQSQVQRTRLTAFGESRIRPFAVYRDSLAREARPVVEPTRPRRWTPRARAASHYSLSQFMVEVAPWWSDEAPRAAIVATDQGSADWFVLASGHVALGWERHAPSVEQLEISIRAVLPLTALPRSALPFR